MTIEKVRDKVNSYKGKNLKFRFNGSRNQIEEFEGTIINTYDAVFIIRLQDNQMIKSFSYSDMLIKKLVVLS
ncbi:MAG TPA: Veg family protein [Candidatus Scybalousia intestinigallinarum]|nr:Veg family protein [Candidatus Scybalousia intestinigallinarum]